MNISFEEYQVLLRQDFVAFMVRAFHELNPNTPLHMAPYIELMAARLEDCRQGRVKRLIINLPPRYLKSHTVSIAFVAWILGHQPSAPIICASYGQDLADSLGLNTRKLMQSAFYQSLFPTRLAPDKHAVSDFLTTKGGGRMATSVGGVLTGRGGDMLIIDDPSKPEEVLSETQRQSVNNWFDSTMSSRLNDKTKGCIIVIMQRLHQDDLVGHLLEQENWTVVSFPAIAEVDEHITFETVYGTRTFKRQAGQALHPERESVAMLRDAQKRIGTYNFSSQYQQNPIPVGGNIVKEEWLMTYDDLPADVDIKYRLMSCDTAVKTKEINDFSVITLWVVDKQERYYLVEVIRKKLEYPDLKRAIIEAAARSRPNKILIEDKSSGSSLIQDLKREGVFNVQPYEPPSGQDKIMRLHTLTHIFESGKVFLPQQAPWLHDYRTELLGFPASKHDDQVDSTTQALDYLHNQHRSGLATWAKLGRQGPVWR
jgi:predicted phage terminase large subunit-like protein